MPIKDIKKLQSQSRLIGYKLSEELNPQNKLYKLRDEINWAVLEKHVLANMKVSGSGRERHSVRLLLGLLLLQAMNNTSDRLAAEELTENIYWQYFCGYEYLEQEVSISESSIRRFRQALGEEGLNAILREIIKVGINIGAVKKKDLTTTIIDTTVQKKNIKHPHDAILMEQARLKLVGLFHRLGIYLNDTYAKFFKEQTHQLWRYKDESKAKSKIKLIDKMKTRLGRLVRLLKRQLAERGISLSAKDEALWLSIQQIYQQSSLKPAEKKHYKKDHRVLYSLHAPEVECIGKGKLHKPYEFGNKVAVMVSGKKNFVLGVKSFHGNPYDGHTLDQSVKIIEANIGTEVTKIFLDRGYRGSNYKHKSKIYVPGTRKQLSSAERKMQKRRNAIEPIIGHLKNHGRMACNYLRGVIGDILNPLISAVGFNLRSLAKHVTAVWP